MEPNYETDEHDEVMYSNVCEEFPQHKRLTERFKKTLYYGCGAMPKTDRPSLPLTEIAVELFQGASPENLGQVDTLLASSMARKACMSPCSMMLGMIYIERLKNKNPEYVQKMSSADLFLLSMISASKYLYDEGTDDEVFNDEWAESASMELDDLNKQERNYLSAIDWKLFVHPEEFWEKVKQMEKRIAWDKSRERGWMSYTDTMVLSQNACSADLLFALSKLLSKVVLVCSVAYMAAVGTILASTLATVALKQRLPIQDVTSTLSSPSLTEHSSLYLTNHDVVSLKQYGAGETVERSNESMSVDEEISNEPQKQEEQELKKFHSFGIPGLLTFALLQDTVCQFVHGVKLKMQQGSNEAVADPPVISGSQQQSINASKLKCTCGKQAENNKGRRRKLKEDRQRLLDVYNGNVNKLWNMAAKRLSSQIEHEKMTGRTENCDSCYCCSGEDSIINMIPGVLVPPVSELVLTHGQTQSVYG